MWTGSTEQKTSIVTKSKGITSKGRSLKTYQNKLAKLKNFYNRTFERSKTQKENDQFKNKTVTKTYFCDKYPSFEDFKSLHEIKQANS